MKHLLPLLAIAAVATAGCTAQQQRETQAQGQDAVLAATVATKLASIDIDSSTAVHVAANNGQITLSGQAVSPAERAAYVAAARSVDGVHAVRDDLSVNRTLRGIKKGAADAALQVRVSAAIAAQAGVNVFHVMPAVKDGTVTLTGTVPNASLKSTILTTARGVPGVRRVVDRIAVGR